jgi:hypothetical protein
VFALLASSAAAQEFQPPGGGVAPGAGGGMRFGVLGFSTRGGGQVDHGGQGVLGSTVDIAQLGSPQVRLRPSFEVGFGKRGKSLHTALEVIYRFQPDEAPSVPYVGVGLGYYDSGTDSIAGRIRRIWPNLVMGFELPFRPTFNWLVEYHALDRLGRHRFLIGLATRGTAGGS